MIRIIKTFATYYYCEYMSNLLWVKVKDQSWGLEEKLIKREKFKKTVQNNSKVFRFSSEDLNYPNNCFLHRLYKPWRKICCCLNSLTHLTLNLLLWNFLIPYIKIWKSVNYRYCRPQKYEIRQHLNTNYYRYLDKMNFLSFKLVLILSFLIVKFSEALL